MCDHKKENKERKGTRLEEGMAHRHDHETWTRRSFLNTLGVGGAFAMMLGNLPINAMASTPLQAALSASNTDRSLVLIRLKGGNDGLNTMVPLYDYSTYSSYRPTLAIPQNDLINLSNEIGMPNFMSGMEGLWQNGHMKVLHNVGYEGQNLSHFSSSDIWASAKFPDGLTSGTGIFGRFFDHEYPDYLVNPPAVPPAVHIGNSNNLLFTGASTQIGVSVNNPDQLYQIAQTGALYDVEDVPDCYYGEQLAFTRTIANTTFIYAGVIKDAFDAASNAVDYGQVTFDYGNIAEQLSIVARLIKGNLGAKVYLVEINGFDTHEGQAEWHPALMQAVSESVNLFFQDLAADSMDGNVLAMTISEFGRRIEENGSFGTDHGAAAPLLMFSGAMDGNGFVGNAPDLSDLDYIGNMNYQTDFRSVYATVLEQWLCVDPYVVDMVMDDSYARINGLLPGCEIVSTNDPDAFHFMHQARYAENGMIQVYYQLPVAGKVSVELYNMDGRLIQHLKNGVQETAGAQQVNFNPKANGLPTGNYIYRIEFRGKAYSGKIGVFN